MFKDFHLKANDEDAYSHCPWLQTLAMALATNLLTMAEMYSMLILNMPKSSGLLSAPNVPKTFNDRRDMKTHMLTVQCA